MEIHLQTPSQEQPFQFQHQYLQVITQKNLIFCNLLFFQQILTRCQSKFKMEMAILDDLVLQYNHHQFLSFLWLIKLVLFLFFFMFFFQYLYRFMLNSARCTHFESFMSIKTVSMFIVIFLLMIYAFVSRSVQEDVILFALKSFFLILRPI